MTIINITTNPAGVTIEGHGGVIPAGAVWDIGTLAYGTNRDTMVENYAVVIHDGGVSVEPVEAAGQYWLSGLAAGMPVAGLILTIIVIRRGFGFARES